jgi:hypothetical protein
MGKLTKETRDALPPEDFAVPGKRALPIHDVDHVKMAWDMVSKTKDLTPDERKEARSRIIERAKTHGLDTKDWEKGSKLHASLFLSAMALNLPNNDHPNKMPFSGILTRIGEPSDAAPEGSDGKLITISKEAAEKSLQTLLGMAVDYKPGFDGHAPQSKIGLITAATIEGNAILIEGFIYAADFPEEAAEIKASKDLLGFSYEARELYTNDPDANPCVITDCVFTGAAILLKAKAAYRSTSISANAAEDDFMTPETKAALDKLSADQATLTTTLNDLAASIAKIPAISAANLLPKVEPHAAKLEGCADAMEAAGIGGDPNNGHAVILRRMAGDMRAEAAGGRMPARWSVYAAAEKTTQAAPAVDVAAEVAKVMGPITDALKVMGTQIADLKASAAATVPAPERKTLASNITHLLAKSGIEIPSAEGAKLDMGKLDAALKSLPVGQRLEVKTSLARAGLID